MADESKTIEELEQELDQLRQMLGMQQQKIQELQRHMEKLKGDPPVVISHIEHRSRSGQTRSLENFIGLKLIQFIGIVVLVIGLSIGVKYAIDRNLISEAMRIGLAYGAGLFLLFLSFRVRKKYTVFSAILFSGAMASLYFTTYAAYVYYNYFSFGVAFVLLILFTVYVVYEAVRYDRQEIAILGLVGAYAIPFLISKNTDRADLFFSYIFLINAAVAYLQVRKNWKTVGWLANLITWSLFVGWATMRFSPEWRGTGLLFLCLFFVLFLFLSVEQRLLRQKPLSINEGYQVLINNIALLIGSLYVFGYGYDNANVANITFWLCVVAALQVVLFNYWKRERLPRNTMASYTLILFAMFIAFEWSGVTVTFLWLLTAVVLFVWGVTKKYHLVRMAAIVLMGATLLKLVAFDSITFTTIQKIISYLMLGVLLLVVSYFYQRYKHQIFGNPEQKHE